MSDRITSLNWRRASRCSNGGCVEVATTAHEVRIRDSKDPDSPELAFPRQSWQDFLERVKNGNLAR
jgi:Domain of unknown function (DUF397)